MLLDAAAVFQVQSPVAANGRLTGKPVPSYAVLSTGCWEWLSACNRKGYGVVRDRSRRKNVLAHRFIWERHNGPIPDNMELDHLCRNPKCVNPAHLEPVTHEENVRRGLLASRTKCFMGHDFSVENTYKSAGSRGRKCRACSRLYRAERWKRYAT